MLVINNQVLIVRLAPAILLHIVGHYLIGGFISGMSTMMDQMNAMYGVTGHMAHMNLIFLRQMKKKLLLKRYTQT